MINGVEKYRLTEEEFARASALRHDLHMHPELSREEYRTTEKIREFLAGIPGCRILDLPVKTGVAAQIPGNRTDDAGHEVMLRADIDALPQTEQTQLPWKSQLPGVMHACGHDLHTASLCGAALLLERAGKQGIPVPSVDLVFQPAEEGTTGAKMMIEAGLFDRIHPEVCFGFHNWPSVETGSVVCRQGALMSTKRNFDLILYGSGGHGAMPHLNIDPIVCAAAVVQSLQTVISRNTDPLESAILSVNMIRGGSPVNLVVNQVEIKATVRSLSNAVLDRAVSRIETIVEKTAAAYECRSEIIWKEQIPLVWNSPEMTAAAIHIAKAAGCRVADAPPSLASEDFAFYREYVPSFFFWAGSTPRGAQVHELHTPQFCAEDETIRYAAGLYAACAEEWPGLSAAERP